VLVFVLNDQNVREVQAGGFDVDQNLAFGWHGRGEFFPSDSVDTNRVFTKPSVHRVFLKRLKTA
jgi:hypothetical protein